jgi:hypothetical protein
VGSRVLTAVVGRGEPVERGNRLGARPLVQRHGERRAERERVLGGDAVRPQRHERPCGLAAHAQLQDLGAEPGQQRLRRVEGDDTAGVHDRDPVAQPLRLVEVMRGYEDRRLAVAEAADHVEQLVPDARVEADGWLIEEEHLRLRDERAGDLEPAALAAAVGADRPVDELGEPERPAEAHPRGGRGARGSAAP